MLVGVKAELGEPLPDRPNEGRMEFFVDWLVEATYILGYYRKSSLRKYWTAHVYLSNMKKMVHSFFFGTVVFTIFLKKVVLR